jgi:hypothetical protein
MTAPQKVFAKIRSQNDGPTKKFELLKAFANALRQSGMEDPRTLSCAELEEKISELLRGGV